VTTLSASDIAARRIREARTKRRWTVRDLAAQCGKAGAVALTAPVITNLETRRRPGREITAEELLALAFVLGVAPVQLLCPLGAGEALEIVPGQEKGALDAAAWLADEDAGLIPSRLAAGSDDDTGPVPYYRGSALTVIRQIRAAARSIRVHDRALSGERWLRLTGGTAAFHENSITVLGLRLLHLYESLEILGHEPPQLDDVAEILARHGVAATLGEWEQIVAAAEEESGEST